VEFDLVDFYHNALRLIGLDTMKLTAPASRKSWTGCARASRAENSSRPRLPRGHWIRRSTPTPVIEKGGTPAKQVLLPQKAYRLL